MQKTIYVRDKLLWLALVGQSVREGISVSALLEKCIRQYLANLEN